VLKSLKDVTKLRQQLIDKYHESDIYVNLQNSRFLVIVFINSPLNQKTREDRRQRAQEAAMFITTNYSAIKQIQTVMISFLQRESHAIIFHNSRMIDTFAFDKHGAETGGPPPELSTDPLQPTATFSAPRNETDISITRIQLEGDLNNGIALVPHFTVRGNARASRVAAAPEFVSFEFASYADKKVFHGNPALVIDGDRQTIFATKAQLLVSENAPTSNDGAPQFLNAQMPFPEFLRVAEASKVRIQLGNKKFDLSPEDLAALREMTIYVKRPDKNGGR